MPRTLWGVAAAILATILVTLPMLAARGHLSTATTALVLVVPVVVGVAVGGFTAGAIAALVGFLVYDWFFIPPYGTFTVGEAQNWVSLGVYAVVVLVVARLVAVEQEARAVATARGAAVGRILEVTEGLIRERPLDELLGLVVNTVHHTFPSRWVALLMPASGGLSIAAVAGEPLTDLERAQALVEPGRTQSMTLAAGVADVSRISLTVAQRPVGQLVIAGARVDRVERDLLGTFANEAALAIEQSQLREQATRALLLEEVDRWRSALIGAVSHDLRTPLATIKAAVTTLASDVSLSKEDHEELLSSIEDEADHLTRLVANLLDMARIESGALSPRLELHSVEELVNAACASARSALSHHALVVDVPSELPLVLSDEVLVVQVLVNLLSNAAHHAPDGSSITVAARSVADGVELAVLDHGPGIPPGDAERVFSMADRVAGSGRAGLGLAICRAFVEAHDSHLVAGTTPGGGAALRFTLRSAALEEALT